MKKANAHLETLRLSVVERALLEFVEEIENGIPNDDVLLRDGVHTAFAATELSTYRKDGFTFSIFYIWRRRHVLAMGFLTPADPLGLQIAEVPDDAWPTALRLFVEQLPEAK